MSWRNNIGGSKMSHSMFVWFWNFLFCSITPRYEWVSVWLILLLPRILLLYRYSCHGLASSAEWKWMFLLFLFSNSLKRAWCIPFFYVSTLSNYFNEPHVFGNSKAHWGRERKHSLNVLLSVIMEKHNEKKKNLQTSCVLGFDIIYILKLPPSWAHHLKTSFHIHNSNTTS